MLDKRQVVLSEEDRLCYEYYHKGGECPGAIVVSPPQAEQVVVGSKYAESVTDRETYSSLLGLFCSRTNKFEACREI